MKRLFVYSMLVVILAACGGNKKSDENASPVSKEVSDKVAAELIKKHGEAFSSRIEKGVAQAASLWRLSDGNTEDFEKFCLENFISDKEELDLVFDRMANNFEYLNGYMDRISIELNRQIHEDRGPILAIDQIFGSYSPSAHVQDDFFDNKLAFIIILNFPNYTLEEKNALGEKWSDREWGYARLGDMFTARVPAKIMQEANEIYSAGRLYISEYNIFAGKLLDEKGNTLFPEDMRLLSHWNIRDEIKSNYDLTDGQPKQEMLYQVMLRIINQDIPKMVINNDSCQWNPYSNEVFVDGKTIKWEPEGTRRYEYLLNNFNALRKLDPYYTSLDTYIKRSFDENMEIPMEEVEALFKEYASSSLVKEVAGLISKRLGRELRPYDLWYNGFVGRSGIAESELDKMTRSRYPNPGALDNDLPEILKKLGFDDQTATFLGSKIDVDAARGSGHAMGTTMREMPSHLRTRIAPSGMDYKGYNIAIHEFGHNVEQTISTHNVDNYFINGVPNTAFTEALAFMFQKRDLELLGIKKTDPLMLHLDVLDIFWDNYEMMGVSLVDMKVWKWLYENPDADAQQLKEAVVRIAKEVWNDYYAEIFGEKDIPLLAIYSHMIQSPLYLMNYPYGRLIMFQLEDYIADKDFAQEVARIYSIGQLTPKHWMQKAVGTQISNQPIFKAVEEALKVVKE